MKYLSIYIPFILLLFFLNSCTNSLIFSSKKTYSNKWIFKSFKDEQDIFKKSTRYEFSTPTVDGSTIFWGSSSGIFCAISGKSGKKIWEFRAQSRIDCAARVDEKRVFFADIGGNLYCLNKSNGILLWKCKIDGILFTKPLVTKDSIILFDSANRIISISILNGKFLWQVTKEIKNDKFIKGGFEPFIYDEKLYVGFIDGEISILNPETGEELALNKISSENSNPHHFQDIYLKGLSSKETLYVLSQSSGLSSLNISDLSINWNYSFNSVPTSHPISNGTHIYFLTIDKKIQLINKTTGNLIWERKIDSNSIPTTLAIINNYLFIGLTKGDILIFNSINGYYLDKIAVGSGLSSDLVTYEDRLFFVSNLGNLYSVLIR